MKRGFTLLEMMIAVAIIGLMSALSVTGLVNMARLGRVNGACGMLSGVIGAARVRAVTQQCNHFVVINGPLYAAAATTPISLASRILVVKKGVCDSTVNDFEPATDGVVDSYGLEDVNLDLIFSAGIAGTLTNQSVIIAYNRRGQRFFASSTDGTYTDVVVTAAVNITVSPHDPTLARVVTVPAAGAPTTD